MKRTISVLLAMMLVLGCFCGVSFAEEDSFGIGDIGNNTYWNEQLSIGCILDENWYFYSREEILQLNGMTADMLEGQLKQMMEDGGSMMDMYATHQVTGETVNVTLERLSVANALLISEKKYCEIGVEPLVQGLTQIGFADVEAEIGTMEFMGEEHACIRISAQIEGIPFYETMAVVKIGRTIALATAASAGEDNTENTLANFFSELPKK